MHELTLWKKQEIDKLRKDMDSLFRRFRKEFGLPSSLSEVAEPFSMDLSETESTLTVSAELPGIKPEDIHISVTENTLTLPCRIKAEDVKATYKDNTLRIVLPKFARKEARGVRVEIK